MVSSIEVIDSEIKFNFLSHFLDHLPPHLYGISHFGDNIQDEWFIVSLLLHISRELPSIIIRTCDSDGEFLLIEAAEYLPSWANPDTCEQKVSYFLFVKL
jgi:hypothetical protein